MCKGLKVDDATRYDNGQVCSRFHIKSFKAILK